MATTSNLFLYSLTMKAPTAITAVVVGSFYDRKKFPDSERFMRHHQQAIVAIGSTLEVWEQLEDGRLVTVLKRDTYSVIRHLAAFRIPGTSKDIVLVASDSGRVAVLEYSPEDRDFRRHKLETFGHSGVRRTVPGQYLAVDSKGRSCMMASVEKNRIVYLLNRDSNTHKLTISSPLESIRRGALTYAMISLDNGFNNPIFAAIEVDYGNADDEEEAPELTKYIMLYVLDLGLNTVIQKRRMDVDPTAHYLLQVPADREGPGGVVVCAQDNITYYQELDDNSKQKSKYKAWRVLIPRRRGAAEDPQRARCIVSGIMYKSRAEFFYLVQTNDGDLFRLDIENEWKQSRSGQGHIVVKGLRMMYFDTIPVATHLNIFKSGYLLASMESGDHHLYQILGLADSDDVQNSQQGFLITEGRAVPTHDPIYFHPRPLKYLNLRLPMPNLNTTVASMVTDLRGDDSHQVCTITGSGGKSAFRIVRNALAVTESTTMESPNLMSAVFSLKMDPKSTTHDFLILTSEGQTTVLRVGDNMASPSEPGFEIEEETLAASGFAGNSFVQVHSRGIRQVIGMPDEGFTVQDWQVPGGAAVNAGACNDRQVVVGLSTGEVCYFEPDASGVLTEYQKRKEMEYSITCVAIGPVPEGRIRSEFMAVGTREEIVEILLLDPNREDECLETVGSGALPSAPHSALIVSMLDPRTASPMMILHVGLADGSYLRAGMDASGDLIDSYRIFLGPRPVALAKTKVDGDNAVLAMTTKPFLAFSDLNSRAIVVKALEQEAMQASAEFDFIGMEGHQIGACGHTLRIFKIDKPSRDPLQTSIPLALTPRGMAQHPIQPYFYVIEADINTLSSATRTQLHADPSVVNGDAEILDPMQYGYPRARDRWASCIQIVDPLITSKVIFTIDLDEGEAATSVTLAPFKSQDNEHFLAVGTSMNLKYYPRRYECGYIRIYQLSEDGRELYFVHKTEVTDPPMVMIPFEGRVMAGIGPTITTFDIGTKKILRKLVKPVVANMVVGLQVQGSRIAVSDVTDSVVFVRYIRSAREIVRFADDMVPRWVTCTQMIDHDTIAGGDKFGNVWLLRCPQRVSENADEDGAESRLKSERAYLGGAGNRLELMAHFFTGDLPMSMHITPVVSGGKDVIVWSGLRGTIGALVPVLSRRDVNVFQKLTVAMLEYEGPLTGRDHLAYRGMYESAKGIFDGDLLERYFSLSEEEREAIAAAVGTEIDAVDKHTIDRKLIDMRVRNTW